MDPKDFDAVTHTYRPGGTWMPSVTQVLQATGYIRSNHSSLDMEEFYIDRGKKGHRAIHLLTRGELDRKSLDPRLSGCLDSYDLFLAETGIRIDGSEVGVYHPALMYAGTLDVIGNMPGIGKVLGDYKLGPVPEWADLQTAAYDLALEAYQYRRFSLSLLSDGRYRIRWFYGTAGHASWRNALATYHDQVKRGIRGEGDYAKRDTTV